MSGLIKQNYFNIICNRNNILNVLQVLYNTYWHFLLFISSVVGLSVLTQAENALGDELH